MPAADNSPDGPARDPFDLLQHDLKNPLATIHGRAQLLARSIRRSPSLADEERTRLLLGLATIEVAVREMVTLIDGMHHDAGNSGDPTA